ncbi:MAG TPA: S-layer homology domain-containing protein [Citricoccus sp.]
MTTSRILSGAVALGLTAVLGGAMAAPSFATTTTEDAAAAKHRGERVRFEDNPRGSAYYTPVQWMARHGISVGYTDGTFKKTQNVTRGETSAFLHRYIEPEGFEVPEESPFSDVNAGGAYYESITWASSEKITAGYADGTFKTSKAVTRGEFAAFLYRWHEPRHNAPEESPFEDLNPGGANYDAITWLASKGITVGDTQGNFNQSDPITRAEISAFMQRYHAFTR